MCVCVVCICVHGVLCVCVHLYVCGMCVVCVCVCCVCVCAIGLVILEQHRSYYLIIVLRDHILLAGYHSRIILKKLQHVVDSELNGAERLGYVICKTH